jgi:hypothetical protein
MNLGILHLPQLRICLVGLVLMLMPFGLAQRGYAQGTDAPDPAVSSKPDDHKYILAGAVVNSVTGEPIRRAAVQVSGAVDRATLTENQWHGAAQRAAVPRSNDCPGS